MLLYNGPFLLSQRWQFWRGSTVRKGDKSLVPLAYYTLNVRSRGKTKLTGFPRDLTLSVLLYSRLSLQQQQKNDRSEPKQSTRHLQEHKFNSQNHWMNNLQSTFLILSASFSCTSCCFSSGITLKIVFSLRLLGCVVVFIHEKENWQCFSRLPSRHFPPCFDHVL